MLHVVYFSEHDNDACFKYRVHHPIVGMNEGSVIHAQFRTTWEPALAERNLFIFQRNSSKEAVGILYNLVKAGRPVIYDMDDNIFHIPETNPVYGFLLHNPEHAWHHVMGMRYANATTVSCEGLAEFYRPMNPNIHILPNCINLDDWDEVEPILKPVDAVRIFWGGSPTHKQDLDVVKPALSEIKRKYGDRVEFVLMGQVDYNPGFPIRAIPGGSYSFFQEVMCSCDIGIAPMKDDLFNKGKSDLRLKELGCAGLPIIASDVAEYHRPESGAFLCKTLQDWVRAMDELISDPMKRSTAGAHAKEWAYSWDIRQHIHLWEALYQEVAASDSKRRSARETIRVEGGERSPSVPGPSKVRVVKHGDTGDSFTTG